MANNIRSTQTHSVDKLTDCPYFLQDECSKGTSCKYRHSEAVTKGNRKTCHKWEKSECVDINCPNLHLKKPKTTDNLSTNPQKQTKLIDCIYFLNGSCNRNNCKYRHSAEAIRNGICESWCKGQCSNLACAKRHPKNAPPVVETEEERKKDREKDKMQRRVDAMKERNDAREQATRRLVEMHPELASSLPHRPVQRPFELMLHNFAFNMGLYKGSHVSVGVSSNTNMPSVTDQLDAGISSLEIGVFSEIPGGTDWRIGVEQPSATAESLSLRHWLDVINTWTLKNRTHLPLVLILDIKDQVLQSQSFGGGNLLVRIGNLISDLFGNRVFWYQDLGPGKWPSVQQLCGRVIPVLSGSAKARQLYLGKGQEPAVTGNKNGTVVQLCNKADQICYFSGRYNQDGSIDWLHTGLVGTGRNPAVTMNEEGHVIAVYEYISDFKLMYSTGKVLANGDIAWKEPKDYDKGVTPAIALQASGKHFVEVHKSQNSDNLWYHVGKFDAGTDNSNTQQVVAIDFGPGKKYPSQDCGKNPSVRFSASKPNRVEAVHLSIKTGKAWLWDGNLNPADGSIEWDLQTHAQIAEQPFKDKCTLPGTISVENKQDLLYWKTVKKSGIVKSRQQFFVELVHPEEASWPEEFKKESSFISVKSGTDPNAVLKFKTDGKVVRMNHCNDPGWAPQNITGVATIITTDFPEDKFHNTYLEVLNNLFKAQ